MLLPEEAYPIELPFGQIRDGRRVSTLRQVTLQQTAWNQLEIECDGQRNMTVKINGAVVNVLSTVPSTQGHIILRPQNCNLQIRNPSLQSQNFSGPLGFVFNTSGNPKANTVSAKQASPTSPPSTAKPPEIVVVNEINREGSEDHPWVTNDGKTLLWTSRRTPTSPSQINMATRDSWQETFKDIKTISEGLDPTLSDDGKELYFIKADNGLRAAKVFVAKRSSSRESFSLPTEALGLEKLLGIVAPALGSDGNTIYCEQIDQKYQSLSEGAAFSPVMLTRISSSANWEKSSQLSIEANGYNLRWIHVSSDGKYLVCVAHELRDRI